VRTWAEEHRRKTGRGGIQFERDESELLAASKRFEETQLAPKPMSASLVELTLNFSKDPELTERYIATSGAIRLGKVFEDLDTLAGAAAYQHALGHLPVKQDQGSPIFVVTASVDRLDLVKPLAITSDYRLTGSVIYVGSSSMEILVAIEELNADGSSADVCLTGR
jgi:acyl-coenzyme A thioesterase 9